MKTATATAALALGLAFFCLCLNLGLCRTIAPEVEVATTNSSSSTKVVRLKLIPLDSPLAANSNRSEASFLRGLTESDRLRRAIRRSHERVAALGRRVHALPTAQPGGYEAPLSPGISSFMLQLSIGTPPLQYLAILDTGSELTWTQCQPCYRCYGQPTPIFDPSTSTTYRSLQFGSQECDLLPPKQSRAGDNHLCMYRYRYTDSSKTEGFLSTETFNLSGAPFADVAFGCGHNNEGLVFSQGAGIVGFGRGQLSLPSQFARSVSSGDVAFAYCLFSGTNGESPLWLGPNAGSMFPRGAHPVSTPFIMNPYRPTYYYYVSVTAIDIAGTPVYIPDGAFDINDSGEGGLTIDSGSTMTYFEPHTYNSFANILNSYIGLPIVDGSSEGMELCYYQSAVESADAIFPTVTVTFEGGAQMQWTKENYILELDDLVCVAVAPSDVFSSIGNVAQRNYFMLHDISANQLSFARTQCDSI